MCSRHPEPGAGHPDEVPPIVRKATRDFIRKYRSTLADLAGPQCAACSLPAQPDSIYCKGHARLGEYRTTDETHWAANE